MKFTKISTISLAICLATPAMAQSDDTVVDANDTSTKIEKSGQQIVSTSVPVTEQVANNTEATKPCELHVWPTENYIGIKMGLLSGFGPLGAIVDMEKNKGKILTIKDLMSDYLGPDIQMEELEKIDYLSLLKLPKDDYMVIRHDPLPTKADIKENPALKPEAKEFNRKINKKERLTDSKNDCYAELLTTHIFYHKAMMYGSNLFTGWAYRKYDGDKLVIKGNGQVKNPLEEFPPKDASMVDTAKAELREAFALDFTEWAEKKSGVIKKKRRR